MQRAGPLVLALDRACLAVFVAEIAASLYESRLRFFHSGGNLSDFAIVGVSMVPSGQGLTVLRAIRAPGAGRRRRGTAGARPRVRSPHPEHGPRGLVRLLARHLRIGHRAGRDGTFPTGRRTLDHDWFSTIARSAPAAR